MAENTSSSSFLLGDLNLDPNDSSQSRMIDTIRGDKKVLLKEATNKNKKNIDHIFGNSEHLIFCQAFLNFISDHYTITVRIAMKSTSFVDDGRLVKKDSLLVTTEKPEHGRRKKGQIKRGQVAKKQKSVED